MVGPNNFLHPFPAWHFKRFKYFWYTLRNDHSRLYSKCSILLFNVKVKQSLYMPVTSSNASRNSRFQNF
jgi:hypothetical protein